MNELYWAAGYGVFLVVLIVYALGAPERWQSRLLILVGFAFIAPFLIWGLLWLIVSQMMSGINPG
jgi:hypothetical protein